MYYPDLLLFSTDTDRGASRDLDGNILIWDLNKAIGKKHALKKYDQFALNTSCFWGSTGSNITPVVRFHEIFVTKVILLLLKQKFKNSYYRIEYYPN